MPGRVGLPRLRWPRGQDIAAAGVVLAAVLSVGVVVTGVFIENKLKPTDGRFGVPQYLVFPLCGRSYMLSANPYATAMQVEGGFVVEPTVGQVPLTDLLGRCPMNSDGFYDTVIWLQAGPDQYVEYSLQGGP